MDYNDFFLWLDKEAEKEQAPEVERFTSVHEFEKVMDILKIDKKEYFNDIVAIAANQMDQFELLQYIRYRFEYIGDKYKHLINKAYKENIKR